ncbi:MAG: hypothetical protein E7673_02930 [Ruminococcaceae bacterium]|nr:hypothetical protein [Oscillospiraceae bacterium]
MSNENLVCPICGEPTRVYMGNARKDRLCGKHADALKAGELIIDEKGHYVKTTEKANTTSIVKEFPKEEEQEIKKCLLCNEDSGNYLFCKSCFSQHHGKTLLFKITCDKNQKLELLNESYEGIYVCKDGHIVKSKSERDIDNYLFEHKIAHAYEKALPINGEIFKPDFYLKDLDVYIEHWGYDESNKEYTARKEYKIPKYEEKGITLICTYEATDMQDVETSLQIKLESYEKGKINFL